MRCKQCDTKLNGYTQSEELSNKKSELCTKCAGETPIIKLEEKDGNS